MARDSIGRRVQRAGATGGSRTYRGQVPANWYAALVLIVVLGLASIVYARYEYRHPAAATEPAVGTTWYAGISFWVCGTNEPALGQNSSTTGISTTGNGVVVIAPTKASQAGNNATLGAFVAGYQGLVLTSTSFKYPGGKLMTNGDTCPAGTPDAGKRGQVVLYEWSDVETTSSTRVAGDPRQLKIAQNSLLAVAFAPAGAKIPKSTSVEDAVLQASAAASTPTSTTTTTTAPGETTTTAPATTTTTVPPTTTTTIGPATTTTTK
jgi:hypothetical protein